MALTAPQILARRKHPTAALQDPAPVVHPGGTFQGAWAPNTAYFAKDTWLAPDGSLRYYPADTTSPGAYAVGASVLVVAGSASVTTIAASGDATGVTDTAALQTALNSGGIVKGVPGQTYYVKKQSVGAPYGLSIGAVARTTLDMTSCIVLLVAGSDCPVLVDSGHAALLAGRAWAAPADCKVVGGVWDKGANAGAGNGLHNMILGGSNLIARDLHFKSTAGKFSLLLQNAFDFAVENIYCDNTFSDGVHVHGPAARGTIRNVRGKTGDDLVAITPHDYPAYNWGNEGDVTDILIDGVFPNQGGSRALIILGGTNGATIFNTKNITARNISGTLAGNQSAVIVGDDTAQANTSNGQLDNIVVDGVSVAINDATKAIVAIGGSATSLKIDTLRLRNINLQGKDVSAAVSNNGKVGRLIIDGVTGSTATAPPAALFANATGNAWPSVDRLMMSNVDVTFAGAQGGSLIQSSKVGHFLREVFLQNIYLSNSAWLADLITTTDLRASNVRLASNGGVLNVRTDQPSTFSPTVTVVGWSGCAVAGTNSTMASTSSGNLTQAIIRSMADGFILDIANAGVTAGRQNGDRCTARTTNGLVVAGSTCEYNASGAHFYDRRGQASTV